MMEKYLITGAGGFIGFHLAKELATIHPKGEIFCVDITHNDRIRTLGKLPNTTIIETDLNEYSNLSKLPECVDGVFALAALNGTSRFYQLPFDVLMSTTLPTLNILRKYRSTAPIVYASSSEVYASTVSNFNGLIPTPETIIPSIEDVHNPRWSYAMAKLIGEVATNAVSVQFGARTAIVRYHNVYGFDMGTDHFVPDFINKALLGKFEIFGGSETRAFMHISDAISGTISSLRVASSNAPIIHLGSEEELEIEKAARIILEELAISADSMVDLGNREGSVARRIADISKAKKVLGWESKIDFRSGIRKYIEEMQKSDMRD